MQKCYLQSGQGVVCLFVSVCCSFAKCISLFCRAKGNKKKWHKNSRCSAKNAQKSKRLLSSAQRQRERENEQERKRWINMYIARSNGTFLDNFIVDLWIVCRFWKISIETGEWKGAYFLGIPTEFRRLGVCACQHFDTIKRAKMYVFDLNFHRKTFLAKELAFAIFSLSFSFFRMLRIKVSTCKCPFLCVCLCAIIALVFKKLACGA